MRALLLAIAIAAATAAAVAAGVTAAAATVAVPAPAVHVRGNHLVDGRGRRIRLLGVNHSGSEYACIQGWGFFDGPTDAAAIATMASWHIDAVRLPLNEECWLGDGGAYTGAPYRAAIAAYVKRLNAAGMVADLDLHWSAPDGQRATGQQVMADASRSPAFWRSVAAAFRDDPGVLFDLYNEPHDISWQCWRNGCVTAGGWRAAGMQQLVDAVRSTGARQPIVVSAEDWANDASGWLAHRPRDPLHQLIAAVHVYDFNACATRSCWQRTIAPVARRVPVVTTEIGQSSCASTDFIDAYTGWADRHGISYLAWTWNDWGCSGGGAQLISSPGGAPTPFGAAYRRHLRRVTRPRPRR